MRLTDEQIGAELRALRKTPSEKFAAELDAWAAEGFPSLRELQGPEAEGPAPRGIKRLFAFATRRPAIAALAGGAVIVLVASVSVTAFLESNRSTTPTGIEPFLSAPAVKNGESVPQSAQGPGSSAAGTTVPPATLLSRPHNGRSQVQERSASIGLSSDAGKVQGAADGVIQVTDRYNGLVDSSTVHVGGSNGHASFALRIPTIHLNDAMADLSDLGHVTSLDQGSSNVTGSYADAGKAYRDAQAKVASLLEQLHSASSPSGAASVQQQLVVARQQLAAARVALRDLKQRVTLTPVSVQITAHGDGNWSIGDAADNAVGVLEAIAGAMLVALAVLVPLGALLALGWLGTRELNRRRREAALDR
jgi:hypothetical protein